MHSLNGDDHVRNKYLLSSFLHYVLQWGGYAKNSPPLSRPFCIPKYDANWVRMRSIPTRRRVKSKYFHHHLGSKLMAIKFWVKFFSTLLSWKDHFSCASFKCPWHRNEADVKLNFLQRSSRLAVTLITSQWMASLMFKTMTMTGWICIWTPCLYLQK